jgi:hypothetical protein
VVKCPLFVNIGNVLRVDISTAQYKYRVKT